MPLTPTYLIIIFLFAQLSYAVVHNPEKKTYLKRIPKTPPIHPPHRKLDSTNPRNIRAMSWHQAGPGLDEDKAYLHPHVLACKQYLTMATRSVLYHCC